MLCPFCFAKKKGARLIPGSFEKCRQKITEPNIALRQFGNNNLVFSKQILFFGRIQLIQNELIEQLFIDVLNAFIFYKKRGIFEISLKYSNIPTSSNIDKDKLCFKRNTTQTIFVLFYRFN